MRPNFINMKGENFMKKLLSKLLAIVLLISLIPNSLVFAQDNIYSEKESNVNIILDDEHERVAEGVENGYKFLATLNKVDNTIELVKKDINDDSVISSFKINLNARVAEEKFENAVVMRAGSINQNTFSNYEYTKWYGSPNKWELRRPREGFGFNNTYYFRTKQTSSNESYLTNFYNAVEDINRLEKDYLTFVSLETLTGTLGAIFSGGLGTFLAAAGLGGEAVRIAWKIDSACRKAEDNYWEAFNRKVSY